MYHTYFAFLIQFGALVAQVDGSIRLMDGINEFQGRLEVYKNGRWGTVCNNGWYRHQGNVIVACRQLGYEPSSYQSRYRRRQKTFLVDNLICNGQENSLGACQFDVLPNRNCAGRDDYEVNLICQRPPSTVLPTSGDIRLMNGKDAFEGRVEIYSEKNWLSICQNGWGAMEARVACKQLGFNGGVAKLNAFYGKGYGTWRVKLTCDSRKDKLINCDTLAAVCNPRQTVGVICEPPVPYGSSCRPDEQCEGNSICVTSQGGQLCQCFNETTMFWDNLQSTCKMKSGYNESCQTDITEQCANTLVCMIHGNESSCLCLPDMFWDNGQMKCEKKSGYNESCNPGIPHNCAGTLMCNTNDNASTCVCLPDMFWDNREMKCEPKFLYNKTCYADTPESCIGNLACSQQYNDSICQCYDEESMFWDPSATGCQPKKTYNDMCATTNECQNNLVCRKETDIKRCLCAEQGFSLWRVGANRCFSVEQLQAVYIRLELEYSSAQTYCASEVNGSMATWSDFQMVFGNCSDDKTNIWLQTTSEMADQNHTLCQEASMGDRSNNISCHKRLQFVCIHERDNIDDEMCKDFTFETMSPQHLTSSHTAFILTIVPIVIVLLVAVGTVLIYKRKRHRYNKTWNSNGPSTDEGVQAFLNNAYDTNGPFMEHACLEIRTTNEPAYANIATKAETLEQKQFKMNGDNENFYTEVQKKSTGYVDMDGRIPCLSTNVTGDGYIPCHPCTSKAGTRDNYTKCYPCTAGSRDDYILCNGSEMTTNEYNTFSDMTKISTDNDNAYDHIEPTTEDGYGVLNAKGQKGVVINDYDEDIPSYMNSSELPL